MGLSTFNTPESEQAVFAKIVEAIALIQQQSGFGSIEITVHDGRVTQIEHRQKVRFDAKPTAVKK